MKHHDRGVAEIRRPKPGPTKHPLSRSQLDPMHQSLFTQLVHDEQVLFLGPRTARNTKLVGLKDVDFPRKVSQHRSELAQSLLVGQVSAFTSSSLCRQFSDAYRDSWGEYCQQCFHWTGCAVADALSIRLKCLACLSSSLHHLSSQEAEHRTRCQKRLSPRLPGFSVPPSWLKRFS